MELTEGLRTPEIFRRWSAISCLAGAMERRVWIRFNRMLLYPNLYVLLVGPAGIGKGVAIRPAEKLWRRTSELHVAPTTVSKASLMDSLAEAKRSILRPNEDPNHIEYNPLLVPAREFGHFLPIYDTEFMAGLTDLWDLEIYEERKRGKELKILIEKPFLHILGGTTPSYMTTTFPEVGWEQGFASRTIMIFSAETLRPDPFADDEESDDALIDALAHDLKVVANAYGKMEWDEAAVRAFQGWIEAGSQPKPDHPKLTGYLTRREANLAKLCMTAAISRADHGLTITLEDYQTALNWLLEAETYMPDLFKSMNVGGDKRSIDEAYHYVFKKYKPGKPIHESEIVGFLRDRVPATSIQRIMEVMISSRMIEKEDFDHNGRPRFRPVAAALR